MRTRHAALLVFSVLSPLTASAQAGAKVRRVFTSDTLAVGFAQTSPDGKWLVMSVARGTSSSLWITPTAGGALLRLTSDGHDDQRPRWFASGDKLVFESTRPNRDGVQQRYLMILGIDPATGKAAGTPRQVSTEPVLVSGLPSPDGRWLSYISAGNPNELKVIPATGGGTKVRAEAVRYPPSFSLDSRNVYFLSAGLTRGTPCPVRECDLVLKKLPLDGGPVQVLAASEQLPLGVITGDPRFTIQGARRTGVGPMDREIIRTMEGAEVGTVDLPREMVASGPAGDGLGIMIRSNEFETPIHLASVSGGPIQTLTKGGKNWPEAWMPASDVLITDRPARPSRGGWDLRSQDLAIELLPLSGGAARLIPLPQGAGGSGWQSDIGPWFSYQTGNPRALKAVNVTTGQTRTITERFSRGGVEGRGGLAQDGSYLVYSEEGPDGPVIKVTDPATGDTRVVRRLEKLSDRSRRWGYAVHGSNLSQFAARGDSVDLLLTTGPEAPVQRLATWHQSEVPPDEGATWSWHGDRLAICGRGGPDRHPILMIVTLPKTPGGLPERQDFDLGISEICWAVKWQPDDNGVFMAAVVQSGAARADVLHLPLIPGSHPTVLTKDDPDPPQEYLPSPDGKYVAYPVRINRGSSIYVVDLKPLLKLPK